MFGMRFIHFRIFYTTTTSSLLNERVLAIHMSSILTSMVLLAWPCLLLHYSVGVADWLNVCISVYACLCVQQAPVQHMAVQCTVSAPRSLLISLTQSSHSPFAPSPPPTPLHSSPLPPLSPHLPLTTHTRGWADLLFSVSDLCPVPALLLLSPSPPLRWLNLFSGLILLKTIWCVTSSGQEAGRGEW